MMALVMLPIVIAVDGTAACGKGTLARRLAAHYGFAHLDSGALYRLVALGVLDAGADPTDEKAAVAAARAIDPARAGDAAIRGEDLGKAASRVAAIPAVRGVLVDFQRNFAAYPPGGVAGAVIDGRDIGTVIAPHATAKLFVDARPEVRALRRQRELAALGIVRSLDALKAELIARDKADRTRAAAPLKQASDAALLDTSDLDIEAAFAAAIGLVNDKVEKALAARPRG
jgi:CMP/dCMP kinase